MNILLGLVIGFAICYLFKDKLPDLDGFMNFSASHSTKKNENEEILSENEKLSRRNKELQREVEDLQAELSKIRRKERESSDVNDDMEDQLDDLRL